MSRIVQVLAVILGAVWFLPISCTTGTFVAYPLVSKSYEYHMEKGDEPHPFFTVVWQPGARNDPFGYSKLAHLARAEKTAPERSYLMAQADGRIAGVVYKVLSSTPAEQFIEVTWTQDPYGSVSRYRATRSEIAPVFSKVTAPPEFMIIALLYALGFSAAVFAVGRWLRRRVARAKAASEPLSKQAPSK